MSPIVGRCDTGVHGQNGGMNLVLSRGEETMEQNIELGQTVVVKNAETRSHVRTPRYVRGKSGTVIAALGTFRNPEKLAYGEDGLPKCPLYHVRFRQTDLWPDYSGQPHDTAVLEIYEHWLEVA